MGGTLLHTPGRNLLSVWQCLLTKTKLFASNHQVRWVSLFYTDWNASRLQIWSCPQIFDCKRETMNREEGRLLHHFKLNLRRRIILLMTWCLTCTAARAVTKMHQIVLMVISEQLSCLCIHWISILQLKGFSITYILSHSFLLKKRVF